jgi:hypothetical protein
MDAMNKATREFVWPHIYFSEIPIWTHQWQFGLNTTIMIIITRIIIRIIVILIIMYPPINDN